MQHRVHITFGVVPALPILLHLMSSKLLEPACSLCELVVSKPWWGCLGTWDRGCLPGARWFRLGSLVPRVPAQPALRGGSWLSRPARSASWPCRNHGARVRGAGVGFWLPGARWFRLGSLVPRVPAQPALRGGSWLSRPARSASWSCRNHGDRGRVLATGCRWFRLSRSLRSRAGSTGFGEGAFMGWLNRLRGRGAFSYRFNP